jgi:ferredoxin-NADP reductase
MRYDTRLLRRETIAEGTMAFYFERPEGFDYLAGQRTVLSLLGVRDFDGYGSTRTFTLASAPHEPELMIATRMRDTAFKRALKAAPPGLRVRLDQPDGGLTLHADETRPAVFIAGGIGVTPFRSIVRDAAYVRLPHRLWLFYSNRRPEDAPFLGELRALERENPRYRFVPTITGSSELPWSGETGVINESMLRRHLDGAFDGAIFYVAGPPGMVMGMQDLLDGLGVPEDAVLDEQFYGY